MTATVGPVGRVSEIWRYPVKSMQGERLDSVPLVGHGMAGDRALGVRDLTTGKILSAKTPRPGQALLGCRAHYAPGGEILVEIGERTYGHREDAAALDAALTELLRRPVAIVAAGDSGGEVYASEWPELEGMVLSGVEVDVPMPAGSFADLAPLHLLTTGTIAHLQSLLPSSEIVTARFRPGILLDAPSTGRFTENDWPGHVVGLGTATLTLGAATPRCIMITLPQPGLDGDKAVLRTLATANRRDFAGFGNFACLGVYAQVSTPGMISVGDELIAHD